MTTTQTNNNNNNNNKFNINIFLNEQCKDAINFADFIKNIEISHQDLENNAQLGFVSGISKIFLDNLKQLGVNERPFHCTDTKRETMYIKDEDKWTKEADDSKLQKAIQTVSYRSLGKLQEWKQENPEYQDVNSEFSEKCLDMQRNTIAGRNREVYYPKVIHVLENEFSLEHICPNSSEWDGNLDKDRTGNLIPIISQINCSRGNKHINEYSKTPSGTLFFGFIKDIIPDLSVYDNIISHDKKPFIINNELYNKMCNENEDKYKQNFIGCIFAERPE